MATVYLLIGPSGGRLATCAVFANREEAESTARRYNATPDLADGVLRYSVEAWAVRS